MEEECEHLRRLLLLWNQKRGAHDLPARAAFPHDVLNAWLPNLAIVDLFIDEGGVFRTCGSHLHARFGGEQTGRRVGHLSDKSGEALRFAIQRALHSRRPVAQTCECWIGGKKVVFNDLCLPLTDVGLHIGTLIFASYPIADRRGTPRPEIVLV